MPTISQFFGIIIYMYIRGEHNPPLRPLQVLFHQH